jgi:hypothetical protein
VPVSSSRNGDQTLSGVPVSQMPLEALETELSIIREIHAIFAGVGPLNETPFESALQPTIDLYTNRMRELETEIMERTLLKECTTTSSITQTQS